MPPPGSGTRRSGWIVAVAAVVVVAIVAFLLGQGSSDDDEDQQAEPSGQPGDLGGSDEDDDQDDETTTTEQDPAAAAADDVRVDLVVAPRTLLDALEAENAAAVLTIVDMTDVGPATDIAGTRAATDAAAEELATVVADAGAEGEAYGSALSVLDTLASLRSTVDSIPPGTDPSTINQANAVDQNYNDIADLLVSASETVSIAVEGPDRAVGARLFATGMRQRLRTDQLLAGLSQIFNTGPTLDEPDEITAVSEQWTAYRAGLTDVLSDAEGTEYQDAADRLDEELSTFGYLAPVEEILDGATIDFTALIESTSMPLEQGWTGFLDAVGALLTN
jgi:nitrate/nitrite sensing protein